ncbi:MAG: hypothetical protein WCK89_21105 [bacterium]
MWKLITGCCCLLMTGIFCVCLAAGDQGIQDRTRKLEPLTEEAKRHYECLARSYMMRLWTNDYSQLKAKVFPDLVSERQPWRKRVVVSVQSDGNDCEFNFLDRTLDKVVYINNQRYSEVPFGQGLNPRPIHTTEAQARTRSAEIAALFGVSNIWDTSKFETRSFGFVRGKWEFQLSAVINGYPSLYPVIIILTDTPGLNLNKWHSLLDDIPQNPPTEVLINADQAKAKAEIYLKQYFPMKDIVPKMTFMTNSVEYVTPNYNYIRPADDSGFSNYVAPQGSIALVWKNYFKKPPGLSFQFPVVIYVDAATGEMLGGAD